MKQRFILFTVLLVGWVGFSADSFGDSSEYNVTTSNVDKLPLGFRVEFAGPGADLGVVRVKVFERSQKLDGTITGYFDMVQANRVLLRCPLEASTAKSEIEYMIMISPELMDSAVFTLIQTHADGRHESGARYTLRLTEFVDECGDSLPNTRMQPTPRAGLRPRVIVVD